MKIERREPMKRMVSADTKISAGEKIRWVVGFCGFPYAVLMFSGVIMYYFTDVLGIAPAAAGTLLLVARIWDGINDPMMGIVVDRTYTRWGKCRPYILAGGILMSLFTYLLFTNPGITTESGKLAWAYFTYIGFGMSYTVFVMSLKVLPTRLTQDRNTITSLSSLSFIGTSICSAFAALTLMKFIEVFSGPEQDMSKAYSRVALVAAALLLVTCLILSTLKERDFEAAEGYTKKRTPLLGAFKAIITNKPFIGFCLASAIVYIGYYLAASTLMYYCVYNLGNANYYTPLTFVDYATPIIAALAIPPLTKKFGKRSIVVIAFIGIALGYGLRYITGDQNIVLMVALATIAGTAIGFWNVVFTPMSLDCAMYSEYKSGIKVDALFVTSFTLLTKIASGVAGALLGFILDGVGYVQNAETQSESALTALRLCATAGAAVSAIVALIVFLSMFTLKESDLERINAELHGFANSADNTEGE